jgi:hypothetical protein
MVEGRLMSGTDLTIQDLAADGDAGGSSDDGGGDGGGEWMVDLFDRLDDRGVLDLLIAEQFDVDPSAVADGPVEDVETDATPDPAGGDALDADTVARAGKLVIDTLGDVKMSQLVKLAEKNPEKVDRLIRQGLDGEVGK